jgi:hypothetical protein
MPELVGFNEEQMKILNSYKQRERQLEADLATRTTERDAALVNLDATTELSEARAKQYDRIREANKQLSADLATSIAWGNELAKKVSDQADENKRLRRMVDWALKPLDQIALQHDFDIADGIAHSREG